MNLNNYSLHDLNRLDRKLRDKYDMLIKQPRPFTDYFCRIGKIQGRVSININQRYHKGTR